MFNLLHIWFFCLVSKIQLYLWITNRARNKFWKYLLPMENSSCKSSWCACLLKDVWEVLNSTCTTACNYRNCDSIWYQLNQVYVESLTLACNRNNLIPCMHIFHQKNIHKLIPNEYTDISYNLLNRLSMLKDIQ